MMHDILPVLEQAREHVRIAWGTKNLDVAFEDACGAMCASVAICCAAHELGASGDVIDAAHLALTRAMGRDDIEDSDVACEAVYAFNDAQSSRGPVLALFDRALAVAA